MTIDKYGKCWIGSEPNDLAEYLEAFSSDSGYKSEEFRLSKCSCGSISFQLEADDNEGTARRTCTQCHAKYFICDSEEYWEDSEPEQWHCISCNSSNTNIGVGFALYPKDKEIKWLYLGVRCVKCGVLGCFADWKVAYAPSRHLLELV